MKIGLGEKIMFPSGSLFLEGVMVQGESSKAVVISHPHPLYGGDMDNQVVGLVARTFGELGWTTLRFNFRGVGRSQGEFDQGLGEKEDVLAAMAYIKRLNAYRISLIGYSFGAWVNARAALNSPDVEHSLLIAPPVAIMDFSFLQTDPKTSLIIAGDQDPFCPLPELRKLVQGMPTPPPVTIIKGADHFYSFGSGELISVLREWATS